MNTVTTDLFKFMLLRSPKLSPEKENLKKFIKDDQIIAYRNEKNPEAIDPISGLTVVNKFTRNTRNLEQDSTVGRLILDLTTNKKDIGTIINNIVDTFLVRSPSKLSSILNRTPHILKDNNIYIIPEKISDLNIPLLKIDLGEKLIQASEIIESHKYGFNKQKLIKCLEDTFQIKKINEDSIFSGRLLGDLVFPQQSGANSPLNNLKGRLFDTLYLLYILKRQYPVNLEYIIKGIQTIHVIELLAIDEAMLIKKRTGIFHFIKNILAKIVEIIRWLISKLTGKQESFNNLQAKYVAPESTVLQALQNLLPIFKRDCAQTFKYEPFISSKEDLATYFAAMPVIHPIFARLSNYETPFNEIKPIGIGDLLVVKQILMRYEPGEISHIDNALMRESKERVHRRLERNEDIFNTETERTDEIERETQTTDRNEMKEEAENVSKQQMEAGVDNEFIYNGGTVKNTLKANFAWNQENNETAKVASNHAREVVDKTLSRVQTKVKQSRTSKRLFEIEETNKHQLDNIKGSKHVSGIYRWVDKRYKAQVFNYGERLMFEFIVPEPAAFYIFSKIKYNELLEGKCPPKPDEKDSKYSYTIPPLSISPDTPGILLTPEAIDKAKFDSLRAEWGEGLKDFIWEEKEQEKKVNLKISPGDLDSFSKTDFKDNQSTSLDFVFKIESGYIIKNFIFNGNIVFFDSRPPTGELRDIYQNKFSIHIGNINKEWTYEDTSKTSIYDSTDLLAENMKDELKVTFIFYDAQELSITFQAILQLPDNWRKPWQESVYKKVAELHATKHNDIATSKRGQYATDLSNYQTAINSMTFKNLHELMQGGNPGANQELIKRELKKLCISQIMKEFDSDSSDDIMDDSEMDFTNTKQVDVSYLKRKQDNPCEFETKSTKVDYPVTDINKTVSRGKYIQFIEQAFEWQQISYLFYPYFWAKESKWIDYLHRSDDADPLFTKFLQASSARILIAVTQNYESAVMHFLATREPWNGGVAPVLDTPLYQAIHDELREQQDDLNGATPNGDPWEYTVPTSLVYLQDSTSELPVFEGKFPHENQNQ